MKKMNLKQTKLLVFVLNNLYSDEYLPAKELNYFDRHHYKSNYSFDTIRKCEKYIKRFLNSYPEFEAFIIDYQMIINEYIPDRKVQKKKSK